MRDFNIEEAKAGANVCTRKGNSVRILCYDRADADYGRCIVALICSAYDKHEYVVTFNEAGRYWEDRLDDDDLMLAEDGDTQ